MYLQKQSSRLRYALALIALCCRFCAAVKGVSPQCCELAKAQNAFVNKNIPQRSYVCSQQYSPALPPAPDLAVPVSWCRDNCAGVAIYPASNSNAWALPLVTFILAAVIFSMTIPRRLSTHAPHLKLYYAILSLILDAVLLTLDTAFWVFAIMIATGPFILSGLLEIIIDFKVTGFVKSSHESIVSESEKVELLIAVLAGNLSLEAAPSDSGGRPREHTWDPVDPQRELREHFNLTNASIDDRREFSVRLRAILDSQVSFSTTVGAPVLLYIGSFIYSIVSLSATEGDADTARALAFGIWWMIIVHVSVISGSLLASNNPGPASIIHPKKRTHLSRDEQSLRADTRAQMEDRLQAKWEIRWPQSLTYENRYEPVWMWTRGKNKAQWLHRTDAWNAEDGRFKQQIQLGGLSWIFLALFSYFLVFLPCALAFWVEYATPPIGTGCRALTILFYAFCQFIFVILSAWSHFKSVKEKDYWREHPLLNALRSETLGKIVAWIILLPVWLVALFTTFAGTLMQVTGIYRNCWCGSTWHATVSLAGDTQQNRDSASSWRPAGYTAVSFLFAITYVSWWLQRRLRDDFLKIVDGLVVVPAQTQSQSQAHVVNGTPNRIPLHTLTPPNHVSHF